jgi:multidrug efflux pump subunit AcrB
LSALDVVNAISTQNLILPTGTSKIGSKEYNVDIPNAAPITIADLNRIPIKTVGSTTIYMKDVAWVRDGFPPQTNIVRVNGQRSVLLTIQKAGDASTLKVIAGIKSLLPQLATTLPKQLKMTPLADQSVFVLGAINGVVREALLAACLTACYFNSACDSYLAHRAEPHRSDDQHHDTWRTGARRRHSGR